MGGGSTVPRACRRYAFPCLPPGEVPHVPAGPPLPAGEGPGVGLPFNGAAAPPHSQRPQRGQTTVTAGLDLRSATPPPHSHDPNGVARRVKGKSFYVRPLRGREHLGGSTHRRSRPADMQMRPLRGQWGTKHGAVAPFNGGNAALHAPADAVLSLACNPSSLDSAHPSKTLLPSIILPPSHIPLIRKEECSPAMNQLRNIGN